MSLNKNFLLNTTQLYKLSFIQLLQITINKKETEDEWTLTKKYFFCY